MVEEKRRDKRVKENFGILCKIYERTELEGNLSKIVDVSKYGLCFIADSELDRNHILEIILRVPPTFKEKIELFGRVIKSEQISAAEFKTRVAFIDIPPKARNTLNQLIEQKTFIDTFKKEHSP